jgi:hypothetical protein
LTSAENCTLTTNLTAQSFPSKQTQRDHVDELLQAVADKSTLTVSDLPNFLSRGGMIQFQVVEKRARFSVNLDAVNRRHLTMSSKLLKVAMSVKGRTSEGGAQ